jgi:hypothetical protein
MTIKLHRCPVMFAKGSSHPCWTVQRALDGAGIEYEVVKQPIRKSKRTDFAVCSGQRLLPASSSRTGRSSARNPQTSLRGSATDGCLGRKTQPTQQAPMSDENRWREQGGLDADTRGTARASAAPTRDRDRDAPRRSAEARRYSRAASSKYLGPGRARSSNTR